MSSRLEIHLILLLMILKESGPVSPCDTCSYLSSCYCLDKDLRSVPQDLPISVINLYLNRNAIVSLNQSDFSRYTNIIYIDLSRNNLTRIIIGTFSNLPKLYRLDLYFNQITCIQPGSFSNLPQLSFLDLYSNQISNIQPGSFSNLPWLSSLVLSSNKISFFQPGSLLNLPQLRTLCLSSNKIYDIQDALGSLPNLTQLYTLQLFLSSNQIKKIHPGSFSNLPQISMLHLPSNKINNIQPGSFSNLPNLKTLDLSSNQINNIQPGTFSNLPQLSLLDLSSNQINIIPPGSFVNLTHLDRLNLSFNHISNIQTGMFSNLPQLKTLWLNKNKIKLLSGYDDLVLISTINLENNPWQCDCRMVPFRQNMIGSLFDDQITCNEPSRFSGRKLKDINPEDLICEEARIVRFEVVGGNSTSVKGETLVLRCEVSGIPTPDITVTLPSERNVTVESGGRVTVDVNGTITITNVTAVDSGLYICIAASPVGSTSATRILTTDFQMLTSAHISIPVTHVTSKRNDNRTPFSLYVPIGVSSVLVIFCAANAVLYKQRIKKPPLVPVSAATFDNMVAVHTGIYDVDGGAPRLPGTLGTGAAKLKIPSMSVVQGKAQTGALSGLHTNVYENDNKVITADTVSEQHTNVYENDNGVLKADSTFVLLTNVYENDVFTVTCGAK
ncbi:leucine-rich repeat and immunoglobulin-like domain containing-NOGO receptor-interacting protein 4 [Branchiostoma floridae]|uniref:Leucine-rich repeat and immunoglobulin-like domain containing-NOGO receptor-interacting protein 4 n=1 Tax=Branchiostoma floridae TaxID=7739 RepID=A0A9J7L6L4_BRAFL|nr:leucine-rich repeat and immunoglobulin-like domain containing-NOGO receptor-interacting protein 4 [Branchiostoma floridae]